MKISSATFVLSVADLRQRPTAMLPEIAFVGRSNVGKSSLINCLLNRKKLALTSSTPGKTRLLNYFEINQQFHFVDLPGYGFAKVSKGERAKWKRLIEKYMTTSQQLKGVVQIIDSRHGPTALDLEMIEWLQFIEKPLVIVATKIDKLSKSKRRHIISGYEKDLNSYGVNDILPFSSVSKAGRKELLQEIALLMSA